MRFVTGLIKNGFPLEISPATPPPGDRVERIDSDESETTPSRSRFRSVYQYEWPAASVTLLPEIKRRARLRS